MHRYSIIPITRIGSLHRTWAYSSNDQFTIPERSFLSISPASGLGLMESPRLDTSLNDLTSPVICLDRDEGDHIESRTCQRVSQEQSSNTIEYYICPLCSTLVWPDFLKRCSFPKWQHTDRRDPDPSHEWNVGESSQ
jgi:hypothetical protein